MSQQNLYALILVFSSKTPRMDPITPRSLHAEIGTTKAEFWWGHLEKLMDCTPLLRPSIPKEQAGIHHSNYPAGKLII